MKKHKEPKPLRITTNELTNDYNLLLLFLTQCKYILKTSQNQGLNHYKNTLKQCQNKLNTLKKLSKHFNEKDFIPCGIIIIDDVGSQLHDFMSNPYINSSPLQPQHFKLWLNNIHSILRNIPFSEQIISYEKYIKRRKK